MMHNDGGGVVRRSSYARRNGYRTFEAWPIGLPGLKDGGEVTMLRSDWLLEPATLSQPPD